jgi:uncharacterized repeat protein (TIGR03803 family)
MTTTPQHSTSVLSSSLGGAALAVALICALTLVLMQRAQAQTFSVIHNFTGGVDGATPWAGVTIDQGGNLYGTASEGGADGNGTVFKLSREGSGWILTPLHSFTGGSDGSTPLARVVFRPDGKLYGTTEQGGAGPGTVFSLAPPPTACKTALCPWTETVLHAFEGGDDGTFPGGGDVVFDRAGNLYGTTSYGGSGYQPYCQEFGCGTAYKLSRSNGGWSKTVIYEFYTGPTATPYGGVILDSSGNLYGTTEGGGTADSGTVYQFTPDNGSWSQTVLYTFLGQNDGGGPWGGLLPDGSGNFYGATAYEGVYGGGTAFKLSLVGGNWTYNVLYSFSGTGPQATLTMDAAGNLYGTTEGDGAYGYGSVFKLTPSNGSWIYTSLHDFTGGMDGQNPVSNVTFDASGNLYGTALEGGGSACEYGCGDVWEITP